MPSVEPAPIVNTRAYRLAKRAIDALVAGMALVMLCPLIGCIALLIKADSPGGQVLYDWAVVGLGGRPLAAHKFRSMVLNADALKPQLAIANEMSGPVFKLKNDPRITLVGRFLRKFSLDELPQLWSVLKGDMSLVGPRPPLQSEWAHFQEWQRRKLSVKPGLTCLWQIRGRNDISDFDDWVRLDLEYIDNWSVWLDLKILLLTIPAVIRGTGR